MKIRNTLAGIPRYFLIIEFEFIDRKRHESFDEFKKSIDRSIDASRELHYARNPRKRSFPSPDYRSKSVRYPKWMYANQKS